VSQEAAGAEDFEALEADVVADPEESAEPLVDELLASEAFLGSALGAAGEVAEDLLRLSVR
jgi:hypothetical protein